jgi:glycosyltransferase involved in cell wall biosynthesis
MSSRSHSNWFFYLLGLTAMAGQDYVVCLVDDGSRDGTVEFITAAMQQPDHRLHLIQREKTMRGSQRRTALYVAMTWALTNTNCRFMIEMDGDLSHRPEELPQGLGLLKAWPTSSTPQKPARQLGN